MVGRMASERRQKEWVWGAGDDSLVAKHQDLVLSFHMTPLTVTSSLFTSNDISSTIQLSLMRNEAREQREIREVLAEASWYSGRQSKREEKLI